MGNRQTQTTTIGPAGSVSPGVLVNGAQAYTYDERDRLLTETLGANPATAYTWDADGSLITKSGEATYAWDREMRMVRVTKTDGTIIEHGYDFDGNRVQTTTTPAGGSAAITHYLVDTSGSLSHVVAETNATGGLVAHYVRGDDLLAVMRPNGSGGWTSRFYHSDHIGSVRRLTDEAGMVTDGYTYSAFGELLAHTGTDVQPYAFTGEPYDPNVGFQYHRARWMDARTGRFTAVDPMRGSMDVCTLHRYLYANASPSRWVDRTGLFTQQEGKEAEDFIVAKYKTDNGGDTVLHPDPNPALSEVSRLDIEQRLLGQTPDIWNVTGKMWGEVKPFTLGGIAEGVYKANVRYPDTLGTIGIVADWRWQRVVGTGSGPTIGMFFFINLGGIIFYTKLGTTSTRLQQRVQGLPVGQLLVGHELQQIYTDEATKGLFLRAGLAFTVAALLAVGLGMHWGNASMVAIMGKAA